jgi:hypothetical protein
MPIMCWTRVAVDGKVWSGVAVATRIASMSAAPIPQAESAWSAARAARSEVSCPSAAMWRWPIPVRARIQASDVSRRFDSSSFVTTRSGR